MGRALRTLSTALLLLAGCAGAPEDPPAAAPAEAPRYVGLVPSRERAPDLEEPTAASVADLAGEDPEAFLVVDARLGRVVHAVGHLSAPSGDAPDQVLARFLVRHAGMVHLKDPVGSLQLEKAPTHNGPWTVYRLRQVKDGVPVLRQSIKVELDAEGRVSTFSGAVDDNLGDIPSRVPALTADQAVDAMAAWLVGQHPECWADEVTPPRLALLPAVGKERGRLLWRSAVLVRVPGDKVLEPRAWLLSVDAHSGELLAVTDVTRSCTDGAQGTVVTSSETARVALVGGAPVTRAVETCVSDGFFGNGKYYLEDHRLDSTVYTYDATGYTEPGNAASWYSTCVEPACYSVSQDGNAWTSTPFAFASDFRNGRRILDFYRNLFGRNGADDSGENLILLSGIDYDNATAMGALRSIGLGRPRYAQGMPSYGVMDVLGHEFTHIVNWHEWVGLLDYGTEGALHGAEGATDEHFADMFGVLTNAYIADESWVQNARWAHALERHYAANYPHRNDTAFYRTMDITRNYYLGTDYGVPRAHVSQIYTGDWDVGGVHTNAVLLGRAVYLFAEGGCVDEAPDGQKLPGWPTGGPDWCVQATGIQKMAAIEYKTITTGSFVTPAGTWGLGDVTQAEQDFAAMKAEFQKVANIDYASCLSVASANAWPASTCISVRNAYAGVGLMEADRDYDGRLDSQDNCVAVANANQADADADGVGDACDTCQDVDHDGLGDGNLGNTGCVNPTTDNAPNTPSACADTDHDGCDDCGSNVFNPAADGADGDRDGICDRGDNCVSVANASQADADHDGVGDACDTCTDADHDGLGNGAGGNLGCANPATDSNDQDPRRCADTDGDGCDDCSSSLWSPSADGTDNDHDGLCNTGDNCPDAANPGQEDADHDGVGDACDPCTDADGDGLGRGTLDNRDCAGTLTDTDDQDAQHCGDSDGDGCEDCLSGHFNPAQDGPDGDGDGACDPGDGCPADPLKRAAGQCGCNLADTDTDGDGTADCVDGCPADLGKTAPGTCGCGTPDTDTDHDGTVDCQDACPLDASKLAPGACGCGAADVDSDHDGAVDCVDACPADASKTAAGQCGCNVADTDTDGDGTANCVDGCPADAHKTAPGACGCGAVDTDGDGDGTPDCMDRCPADPLKTRPGQCGCAHLDTDTDGDGTADCVDACPADSGKIAAGACGCGVADTDGDGDGTPDCQDGCPQDGHKTVPGACGCGKADTDTDEDGLWDCVEVAAGLNPNSRDSDGDTLSDGAEWGRGDTPRDTDGDGIIDALDLDSDGDGIPDAVEAGDADLATPPVDTDGDGTPDTRDTDSDNDGVPDGQDNCRLAANPGQEDTDQDGQGNACDDDDDNDGVPDAQDNCPLLATADRTDTDHDGQGDACDPDDDNDGIADTLDNCPQAANADQADGDGNGVGTACDEGEHQDGGSSPVNCQCAGAPTGGLGTAVLLLGLVGWRLRRRQNW